MASHVVLVAAVAAAVLASLVPGVPAPSVVWKGKKRALVLERPAWKLLGLTGMTGGALWKIAFLYKTALCAYFGRSRVGIPHAQQHHKGGRDAKLLPDLE